VIDPLLAIEAAAAGEPADPTFLRELVPAGSADAPLPTLHRLVEVARDQEGQTSSAAERAAWLAVRGLVHLALARRASRVAVYDLRETLARREPLPGFAEAAGLVGDAGASSRSPNTRAAALPGRTPPCEWQGQHAQAGPPDVERARPHAATP
jgi:hypothetical protein